jgi:hypothetical protein
MAKTVYESKGEGRISRAKRGLRLRGPWRGPTACPFYARADGGGSRLMYAVSGMVQSSQRQRDDRWLAKRTPMVI